MQRNRQGVRGAAGPMVGKRLAGCWSAEVTQRSDALDLEPGIFTWKDPRRVARSLVESAKHNHRRKGTVRQSATSMLNLYVNRAGRNLAPGRRPILERAKGELRRLFEEPKVLSQWR